MADASDPRSRQWAAFLAGAVVMLLIVFVWLAWRSLGEGVSALRSLDLPQRPSAPVPTTPPPEGPHLPRGPLPTPQ